MHTSLVLRGSRAVPGRLPPRNLLALLFALAPGCGFEKVEPGVHDSTDFGSSSSDSSTVEAQICRENDTKRIECNTCTCRDGRWACTKKACPPEDEPGTSIGTDPEDDTSDVECREGDSTDDGCNTCTCQDGLWSCTDRACPFDPCAGKTCGEPCDPCAPDDLTCVEDQVVRTCNQAGECTEQDPGCAVQPCGGIAARPCPLDTVCVDDPNDNCDPAVGADCSGICVVQTTLCHEIEAQYLALVEAPEHQTCETEVECQILYGHCGTALGGCYYAVNLALTAADLDSIAERWNQTGCEGPVCDCAPPGPLTCSAGRCSADP